MINKLKKIITNDLKRLWQTGAVHITSSQGIINVMSILQRILLARILGAANIGHIAIVKSTFELLQLPANMGMYTSVTKFSAETSEDEQANKKILSVSFWFVLVIALAVAFISFILFKTTHIINDPIDRYLLSILVFFLPFISLSDNFKGWLTGKKQMRRVAKLNALVPAIVLIIAVVLSYFIGLNGWFISYICFMVLGFTFYFKYIHKNIQWSWDFQILKKMLHVSIFAFLGQSIGLILLRFDTLCISGILKDPEATGIYNVAALASQQLMIVVSGILYTAFPSVAQNKHDINKLRKDYKELSSKLFLISIFIFIAAYFLSPLFFFLFGKDFHLSIMPFRILLVSYLFRVQYVIANTFLDGVGRTDITFISGSFAMVVNIILNIILIPKWGINGAAWATVFSFFISMILREFSLHYFVFHKQLIR